MALITQTPVLVIGVPGLYSRVLLAPLFALPPAPLQDSEHPMQTWC